MTINYKILKSVIPFQDCEICERENYIKRRKEHMQNKDKLEEITINSVDEWKMLEGKDITGKHLIVNITDKETKLGTLDGCIVEGGSLCCNKLVNTDIINSQYIYAEEIHSSTLINCGEIKLGECQDGYIMESSKLLGCKHITLNDAEVKNTVFDDFEIMFITATNMDYCTFSNVVCDNECVISMEDGEITNSSFENINLLKDAYLIDGYGSPWVETSVFKNVQTSRDDNELFRLEEIRGIIFKRKKEFCFVDEDSCIGLV